MKTSCNGCRILRKGCSDDCGLRPCLDWIKTPESQANATLFLAKFYGRAGLLNLINAGPNHLRPAIFRSLLYEACGRIVNPVYGSVGLLWSNNWDMCQSAIDAVLSGSPIMQSSLHNSAEAAMHPIMPLDSCDIRHLSKDQTRMGQGQVSLRHRGKARPDPIAEFEPDSTRFSITGWRAPSHDSSAYSVETVEAWLMNLAGSDRVMKPEPESSNETEIGLELSLGLQSSVAKLRG